MSDTLHGSGILRDEAPDIDAIYRLLQRPAWHALAACHGKGDVFFVEREPGVDTTAITAEARVICSSCPVGAQCAEAGRDETYGVWSGATVRERREARRQKPAA